MKYFSVKVSIVRKHFVNAENERDARVKALELLGIDEKTLGVERVDVEFEGDLK